MKKIYIASITAVILGVASAANAGVSDAKQALLGYMKDPESIKWGEITISKLGRYACLTANSKNNYGAYTGYYHHILVKLENSNDWSYLQYGGSESHPACVHFINTREYYGTPEGKARAEKEELERKRKEEAQWAEIDAISKAESKKRAEERAAFEKEQAEKFARDTEEYEKRFAREQKAREEEEHRLIEASKQRQKESEIKAQQEQSVRDEETKRTIEASKTAGGNSENSQGAEALIDSIKSLKGLFK